MRMYDYALVVHKSGEKASFRTTINDRYGTQTIDLSSVRGWRCTIASKHLMFETDKWSDDVTRKFVGMHVLKCAKNQKEAVQFLDTVKSLGTAEIHFWAYKFISNKKTSKAWRSFYGGITG